MKEKMGFEEFKKVVKESIISCLPESFKDAKVYLQTVTKNNDLQLTGLTIMVPNQNIAPTIYLESFYEQYQKGEEVEEILERIAELQLEHEKDLDFDTTLVTNFENCKNKIYPKIISAEWNQETLGNCPYVPIEDLVVTFYIDLSSDGNGSMCIKVHNGFLSMWKVTTEELYDIAISNLKRTNSGTFQSMSEVMFEMMLPELLEQCDGDEEAAKEMFEAMMPKDNVMYVLSNKNKLNGANMILNSEMMLQVIERVGEEFFILPSSIHECLIVPAFSQMGVEELRHMVCEVNDTQVDLEERLSDNVYKYSLSQGFKIA